MSLEEARRKESVLFSGIPWHPVTSHLDNGRMGIDALRKGLNDIYVHQVQAEFPGLTQKIRDQLVIKNAKLQALEESTLMDQRSYLKNNVSKYKSRADKCLSDGSDEGIKESTDHLTAQLEKCIKTLRNTLTWDGNFRRFYNEIDTSILCGGKFADSSGIYSWINERYQKTPGYKLPGCIPESLITELFIEQISPWEKIIGDFSTKISRVFRKAILECCQFEHEKDTLLQHKCQELLIKALEAKMDEFRHECLARSKYEPSCLLKDETEKRVFDNQIRNARTKLLKSALVRTADPSGQANTEKLAEYLNGDQYVIFQIHDILRALFDMAMEDYTDWVAMSFLGLDYTKEVMDVYNNQIFDALSNGEIRALFKPDSKAEKAMKALEDDIKKLEAVQKDLDAIVEKPYCLGSGTKPVDTTANGSSDMPIRTKPGQGLAN
jgi:hypothetical protein